MTQDISTRILHADRLRGTEHGATLKPIHIATGYGYASGQPAVASAGGPPPEPP